jgi:3-dehydroquinate synthase
MPSFEIRTPQQNYHAIVERRILGRVAEYLPAKAGKVFVVTTEDVWRHQGQGSANRARPRDAVFCPAGKSETPRAAGNAAEEMVARGADPSSIVIAFGGGIVTDMAGFLAAIFMRGIPCWQVPTTLLRGGCQPSAARPRQPYGGQEPHRQLSPAAGCPHRPAALDTPSGAEYRAGLFEVIKYGIISSPELFRLLTRAAADGPVHTRRRSG